MYCLHHRPHPASRSKRKFDHKEIDKVICTVGHASATSGVANKLSHQQEDPIESHRCAACKENYSHGQGQKIQRTHQQRWCRTVCGVLSRFQQCATVRFYQILSEPTLHAERTNTPFLDHQPLTSSVTSRRFSGKAVVAYCCRCVCESLQATLLPVALTPLLVCSLRLGGGRQKKPGGPAPGNRLNKYLTQSPSHLQLLCLPVGVTTPKMTPFFPVL